MRKRMSSILCVLALAAVPRLLPGACQTSTCQPDGTQPDGAKYRICMPERSCWNGNLVVFAHGYVAPNEPIAIPDDQLVIDGVSVPALVNKLGYGFAVSSYNTNGLAVLPGIQDLQQLVGIFQSTVGATGRVYLVGPSEGGLITALSAEQLPQVYNAGLPACGPIGSFQRQIDYLGNFRVVFDYFFPGLIPGSPVSIPQSVMDNWDAVYVPAIQQALNANPLAAAQLLNVTKAPVGPNPSTVQETVTGVLWYNVFGTNDASQKLGGQPFDNLHTVYSGSLDDRALNQNVERFAADPAAVAEVAAHYETTGRLPMPAVTLHTIGDPIIPYWHELLYAAKVSRQGAGSLHDNIPPLRYGHCNFTVADLLVSFGLMVFRDSGQQFGPGVEQLVPASERDAFVGSARQFGILSQ